MTNDQITYPVPVGQLLEQLRAQGFSVSPGQYGRVFAVVERVFPAGVPPGDVGKATQTLRELIGPLVCRTAAEQERFKAVFNSVMMVDDTLTPPPPPPPPPTEPINWLTYISLICAVLAVFLIGFLLWVYFNLDSRPDIRKEAKKTWPGSAEHDCSIDFGVQSVQGDSILFVNRSPGLANGQGYVWDFGDGSRPVSNRQSLVGHRFRAGTGEKRLRQVTLKAVGCEDAPQSLPTASTYNPTPLSFLRLPETSRYTLSGWFPLLLMGLAGLLGGGWWLNRRGRQQRQAAQRPTGGPFFLSFPPQDDAIQPSPSLISWAHQLQQREESQRHMLAIGPTIRQTIRNGGMPDVQYESIKRRPRYLILIDDRSAYDQQAKLYAYVMGVLVDRSVEMDVFFFHSDPRYLWNEICPNGLAISDLFRLYSTHYLVLVTEGMRLMDYDRGEVADWAVDALSGWTSRALLTPVYPVNWHYLEAALSRFFILLPATPDGQFLLRQYLGQPDNVPSFEELLRRFKVLPGTPNRGMFAATRQATVDDVRNFLNMPVQAVDQQTAVQQWLFTWACATAVFPTPDWAITLAIGRALETAFKVDGLVTSTNILKLTALPWLRQDQIPEPLRTDLLAQLPPEAETVARQTVVRLLNELRPGSGSVAYEEQQLRLWEQEYHLHNQSIGRFATYRANTDLIKDPVIQEKIGRQKTFENKYQPVGLLLLALLPLLLYLTAPQTQVASMLLPLFRADSVATDSAAFYNNRAVERFNAQPGDRMQLYSRGVLDLFRSVKQRLTFEAVYNLNTSRYNLALLRRDQQPRANRTADDEKAVQQLLSPFAEVRAVMAPLGFFDTKWVPDSATIRQYLLLLTTKADNNGVYDLLSRVNQTSVDSGNNQGIGISAPVDRTAFNQLVEKAKARFQSPGTLEFVQDSVVPSSKTPDYILLAFRPTITQRDSLISLEAARMVLYFGGPKRSEIIPLEPVIELGQPTYAQQAQNAQAQMVAKPGIQPNRVSKAPVRQVEKVPSKRPTPSAIRVRPPATVADDNVLKEKQAEGDKTPRKGNDYNQPVQQAELPTSAGNEPPVTQPVQQSQNQQQQQPPIQQSQNQQQHQPTIPELKEVYRQETKCESDSLWSFALAQGNRQTVRPGVTIQLSDSPNLYELTLYCGPYPQQVYCKPGFSSLKIERDAGGLVQLLFYQPSRKMKMK